MSWHHYRAVDIIHRYWKDDKDILQTTNAQKFVNFDEMDKLLESYKLTKLTLEETDYVNSSINETETIVKNLPSKKTPGFTGEFYQTVKEEIIWIPHTFFQKIEEARMLPKSFNEASIILISNSLK